MSDTKLRIALLAVITAVPLAPAVAPPALAASGTWTSSSDGNWSDTTKWSGGIVADGVDNTANFSAAQSSLRVVTMNANHSLGHLAFEDTDLVGGGENYYEIDNNTLTLSVTSGTPTITNTTGSIIFSTIAGNQGFQKLGPGELRLLHGTGNTYTGNTTITAGTVRADVDNAFNTNALGGTVFVNSGGKLEVNSPTSARNFTLNGGTLQIDTSINTTGLYTISAASALVNPAANTGGIGIGAAATAGPYLTGGGNLDITVNGVSTTFAGMWGVNTGYTGTWNIKSATGFVALREMRSGVPSGIGSGAVIVEAGGKFAYDAGSTGATDTGAIDWTAFHNIGGVGNVRVEAGATTARTLTYQGATITPGLAGAPGILTIDGNLALDKNGSNVNSTVSIVLNGATAGSGYSQLVNNNNSETNGLRLTNVNLVVSLGYAYISGDKLFIVLNDSTDAITGTFAGLSEGATVALGSYLGTPYQATISYLGNSSTNSTSGGNDVVLYNFVALPEPASAAMLAAGALVLAARRRKTR